MVRADAAATIERPPEVVFEFVAWRFFDNYPRWSPEVEALEPLSGRELRLGAEAKQVRVDHGRRSETVFRVTELEPQQRVRFEAVDGPAFAVEYRFDSAGPHCCHLAMTFELHRLEVYMRPFERLIRRAVRRGSEQAVSNIKELLESS